MSNKNIKNKIKQHVIERYNKYLEDYMQYVKDSNDYKKSQINNLGKTSVNNTSSEDYYDNGVIDTTTKNVVFLKPNIYNYFNRQERRVLEKYLKEKHVNDYEATSKNIVEEQEGS